jgi:hypothetical protein
MREAYECSDCDSLLGGNQESGWLDVAGGGFMAAWLPPKRSRDEVKPIEALLPGSSRFGVKDLEKVLVLVLVIRVHLCHPWLLFFLARGICPNLPPRSKP